MLHNTLASASLWITFGIPILALVVGVLGCLGYARAMQTAHGADPRTVLLRALAWVTAWAAIAGITASSGVLMRTDLRPPPFAMLFVVLLSLGLVLGLGRVGRQLATLPVAALIGFQAFRLPLELLLHRAALDGVMPVQMSFEGWNFDILSGLSAIPVAYLASRGSAPRALLIAWNALGTCLLVAIITIAWLSSPFLARFGSAPHQINTWVAHMPFVYLPAVLVVAAVIGHLTLWRKLLATSKREVPRATSPSPQVTAASRAAQSCDAPVLPGPRV